jgi:hypothetical protein
MLNVYFQFEFEHFKILLLNFISLASIKHIKEGGNING